MIYIIFDQSYECDGYDGPSNIIKYMSTNKEDAIAFFDKYFSNPTESETWHYEYELIEFEDGCNFIHQGKQTTLRHTCHGGSWECDDAKEMEAAFIEGAKWVMSYFSKAILPNALK